MGHSNRLDVPASKAESGLALLLTALAVYLHFVFLTHAGPLWRDEVSLLRVAAASNLTELWSTLEFDSFPALYPTLLRVWDGVLGSGDGSLRFFGFSTGLVLLGALWLNARLMGAAWPLMSLALLGFNPFLIRTGDSLRGYGLGFALMVAAQGLIWRAVRIPSLKSAAAAALAAVLSVQCLYQNSFFLLAACLAGMAVGMRRSSARQFAAMTGIGLAAALSLLPYVPLILRAKDLNAVIRPPVPMVDLATIFQQAAGGEYFLYLWAALFVLGLLAAAAISREKPVPDSERRDLALYCAVSMAASALVMILFIRLLGYMPQPRYALSLMVVTAAALDAVSSFYISDGGFRKWRVVFAAALAGVAFFPVHSRLRARQTNMDQVAETLEKSAVPGDLVVVSPWYYGISFSRYYQGRAPWTTVPPLSDLSLYRYDLLKKALADSDPLMPVLSRAAESLKSGGNIWLVGDYPVLRPGSAPPRLPPAPQASWGWYSGPYLMNWSAQVSYFLQTHAASGESLTPTDPGISNPDERIRLESVSGWRNR